MVYSSVCQLFIEPTACTFTITCIFLNVQMYLNSFFFKTQHIVEFNKECFWFMNFSQISIFQFEYLIAQFENMVEMVYYPSILRPKQEIQQNTRNHCKTLVLMSITGVLYYKLNRQTTGLKDFHDLYLITYFYTQYESNARTKLFSQHTCRFTHWLLKLNTIDWL